MDIKMGNEFLWQVLDSPAITGLWAKNLITTGEVRPAKNFRCLAAKSLAVGLDNCGTLLDTDRRMGLSLDDFIPMDITLVAVTV